VIVVTGGAGFIGSALVWRLNQRGINDILIVDHLGKSEKWRNLVGLRFLDYLDKSVFISMLESGDFDSKISAVLHMGACSATTELDADYLMENNYRYTLRIGKWWEKNKKARFIYASSAATYGDGAQGYDDDESKLYMLKPLNMYGYSKHLFDCMATQNGWLKNIAGLKFFNVFGPNEDHKGDMRSVINKAYPRVRDEGKISLFQSHRPDYKNGEQLRDFVYIKDVVEMTLYFLDHPEANGIFNIGTGKARSWNDIAMALFKAAGKKPSIEYVPMPQAIRDKYQYFTQANPDKLRRAGCLYECRSLEDSILDYVNNHLQTGTLLGNSKES
jgi:ADP-L-glycero-D-manno-heptose 6-epimerase